MKSLHAVARTAEVASAIRHVKANLPADPKLQSFLAIYLAVLASGVYEDVIETLFSSYAAKNGNPQIQNFFRETLNKTFRNPDSGKVKEFLNRVDTDWGAKFDGILRAGGGTTSGMDSIVNNKNQIAHGGMSSATVADVEKFHAQALAVLDAVEQVMGL